MTLEAPSLVRRVGLRQDQKMDDKASFLIRRKAFAEIAKFLRQKALVVNDPLDAGLLLKVALEIEAMK